METYPEQFPDERRPEPSYRSEDPERPEMDFTLWLPGVGRFGLQVKGGQ